MPTLATLTLNPALDIATSVSSVAPEIKLRCAAARFHPGGGGINVARAVHFLGGEGLAVYASGGHTGAKLSQLLADEGVRCRAIPIAATTRESFTCYEDSTGLQYRFTLPGPALSGNEWRACVDASLDPRPDFLVVSGSLPGGVPDDFHAELATRAKTQNTRLIIDSAGHAIASVRGVYLLKPNLRELGQLAGGELSDEAQIRDVAQGLVAAGVCEALVVSMGAAGALLATQGGSMRLRAPVVPIRSKVGAGDSMVAGIALALSRRWDLQDAARFGVAAGSAAVMTPGTQLCRREDAERLYRQIEKA